MADSGENKPMDKPSPSQLMTVEELIQAIQHSEADTSTIRINMAADQAVPTPSPSPSPNSSPEYSPSSSRNQTPSPPPGRAPGIEARGAAWVAARIAARREARRAAMRAALQEPDNDGCCVQFKDFLILALIVVAYATSISIFYILCR